MFGELRITHSRHMGHTRTPNDQQQLSKYVGTLVKDPKQLAQCSCEGPQNNWNNGCPKSHDFLFCFFINISERSRKLLFLISTTKTSHNCHMLKWSFFSRRSQDFLGSVRSAWRGECDLYPLSKCGLIRLHYPPPVQPYIACYFHVPEPFLREHLFLQEPYLCRE